MSFVAIGLFVLACGWNVYRLFLPTRSAAIRVEGHPQYFGAALAAGYVGFLAVFLHAAALKHQRYQHAVHALAELAPSASDDATNDNRADTQSKAHSDSSRAVSLSLVVGKLSVDHASISPPVPALTAAPSGQEAGPAPMATSVAANPYETALGLGLWSALLAVALPLFLNAPFFRNSRLRLLAGRKNFNEIEQAAVEAFERQTSLLITLNSGKVYIGFPGEFDPTGDAAEWFRIWPIASGYRTRKGNLRLTTSYEEAYSEISQGKDANLSVDDFEVLLPLSGIASVQRFKLRFYLDHFAAGGSTSADDDEFIDALIREGLVKPENLISGDALLGAARASQEPPAAEAAQQMAVAKAPASPVAVPPNPWPKQVPDWWLRALKWAYHLCLTGAVVSLPFSFTAAGWFAFMAFWALTFTVEPADEVWSDIIESIKDVALRGR